MSEIRVCCRNISFSASKSLLTCLLSLKSKKVQKLLVRYALLFINSISMHVFLSFFIIALFTITALFVFVSALVC